MNKDYCSFFSKAPVLGLTNATPNPQYADWRSGTQRVLTAPVCCSISCLYVLSCNNLRGLQGGRHTRLTKHAHAHIIWPTPFLWSVAASRLSPAPNYPEQGELEKSLVQRVLPTIQNPLTATTATGRGLPDCTIPLLEGIRVHTTWPLSDVCVTVCASRQMTDYHNQHSHLSFHESRGFRLEKLWMFKNKMHILKCLLNLLNHFKETYIFAQKC